MKLLFTGGGGAGNEALWRKLSAQHELFFADADPLAIDPCIPVERRLAVPFARDADFVSQVVALCERHRIDVLVPGVDEELPALSRLHGQVRFRILLPQAGFVELMLDKLAAMRAIAQAGLAVPETRPLRDYAGIEFPLIAKPRSGRGSRGVMTLKSAAQIDAYLTLQEAPASDFVAQQRCVGEEYTVFVAADAAGRLRAVIPVRVQVKRGITIVAVAESQARIVSYVQLFQNHFRATGVYNLQCILTADGRVMPFEINPRVSTTFCLALETGFDVFTESTATALFVPERAVGLRRHWRNDFHPVSD